MSVTLDTLKSFSLSKNYFLQVVKPLFESEKFEVKSRTALKTLLQEDIHGAFWKSPKPPPFDNALAGKFQEVLDVYRQAVKKQKSAQLGSFAGIGGDTVIKKINEETQLEIIKTAQFKTVASENIEGVHENIQKASWQLCGLGGETPAKGSLKVVEVILYRTLAYTSFTAEQWAHEIKEALLEGYSQSGKGASPQQLFDTVDVVKITTKDKRYKFAVNPDQTVTFISEKDTLKEGFIFEEARLRQHWEWLRGPWWEQNIQSLNGKDELVKKTRQKGVGKVGTYASLPFQSNAV